MLDFRVKIMGEKPQSGLFGIVSDHFTLSHSMLTNSWINPCERIIATYFSKGKVEGHRDK